MLGNENPTAVFFGEHLSRVKPHSQSSRVRLKINFRFLILKASRPLIPEPGIFYIKTMDKRESEMLSFFCQLIKLIRGLVIAHVVAAIVGKPKVPGFGIPVEPDGIPYAMCNDLQSRAVLADSCDRCKDRVVAQADVARSTYRHIKLAVRTEPDELPAMPFIVGVLIGYNNSFRRRGKMIQNVRVFIDS